MTRMIKVSALVLLALQGSVAAFAQKITFSGKQVPMQNVFTAIKQQTGFVVFSDYAIIQSAQPVTVAVKEASVSEFLSECLKGQELTFSIEDKTITIVKKATASQQEQATISGRITDQQGNALPGVTILVKGTSKGIQSTADGSYTISNINIPATLVFSFIGFETQEIKVNKSTVENIKLQISTNNLNAISVVSTGYQELPKERATGAFASVDESKLKITNLGALNFAKGLEGMVPGVLVGPSGALQVRGKSTINASAEALIVVDGFPIEGGNLTINPNDIESVTVLKDAAAASIWGIRASNGVIVIKTKNGKSGKTNFNLTTNLNIDSKPDFSYQQLASTEEYIDFENEMMNKGISWFNPAKADDGYSRVAELYYKKYKGLLTADEVTAGLSALKKANNLSQQDLFYRNAIQRQVNLSLSGGGNTNKYYASALYSKGLATARGNDNENLVLNLKNTLQVHPRLTLALGVNSTFIRSNTPNNYDITSARPYELYKNPDGSYVSQYTSIAEHLKAGYYANGYSNWDFNPLQNIENTSNVNSNFVGRFNLGADYKIAKGIVFSSKYLYELGFSNIDVLQNPNTWYVKNLTNSWRVFDANKNAYVNKIPFGSIFDKTKNRFNSYTFRNTVTLDKTISLHAINAVAGTEIRRISNVGNGERYYNYNEQAGTSDIYDALALSTYTPNYKGSYNSYSWSPNFSNRDNRFFSLFANAAYTYDNRYTVSGSMRIDQSDLFGTDPKYRYRPIWSSGFSWRISREQFMSELTFIDDLKLRATYGITGNIAGSSPFPIASTGKNSSTQENLLTFTNPENQALRPEKTATINLGTDFSFWHNRFTGSIDVYRKRSYDLLGSSILDPTTGFTRAQVNTAALLNKGIDINLSTIAIDRKVRLDITVNFGWNKNEVTAVNMPSNTANAYITGTSPVLGKPLSYLYSYQWAGLSSTGTPQVYDASGKVVKYSDAEMTDPKALKYVGTLTPPVYGGVMFNLSYKGFSLAPQFTFKAGYVMRKPAPGTTLGTRPITNTIADRWQKPGDEQFTDIPRLFDNSTVPAKWNNYFWYSSVWDDNASFVRLRSLTLSYNLPKQFLSKIFTGATIMAQGNNLGLWTANREKIDPDYYNLASGVFPAMPPVKSYVLSLNLNF
ncbi:SusC/RagA family TonB-linked outer membrane protein [Chitinophaga silvatica]|nr:SusC/RagA family TonB-linked outer membrane protein [Chitinophaga silvatica]